MNIEPDIFDYLETTSLEPHDDCTSEISYKDQKIIWNRLKAQQNEIERLRKENQQLKEDIKFCINTMKNEYECTDKRTNRELHTMVEILEKWTKEYKEGSDDK